MKSHGNKKNVQGKKYFFNFVIRGEVIVFIVVNLIRLISCLFEPFMPSLSAKINMMLN